MSIKTLSHNLIKLKFNDLTYLDYKLHSSVTPPSLNDNTIKIPTPDDGGEEAYVEIRSSSIETISVTPVYEV